MHSSSSLHFGASGDIQNQTIGSGVSQARANSLDQNQSVGNLSTLIESVSADTRFNIETIKQIETELLKRKSIQDFQPRPTITIFSELLPILLKSISIIPSSQQSVLIENIFYAFSLLDNLWIETKSLLQKLESEGIDQNVLTTNYAHLFNQIESEIQALCKKSTFTDNDILCYVHADKMAKKGKLMMESLVEVNEACFLSVNNLVIQYIQDKRESPSAGISPDLMGKMIHQYMIHNPHGDTDGMSFFLTPIMYFYGDGTNKKGRQFIEQVKKGYEDIYANDPEKLNRLLTTFGEFMTERKQADFYMLSINKGHENLQEYLSQQGQFNMNPKNIVASLRFSPYEGSNNKKAEYVGAMNIDPQYQGYGMLEIFIAFLKKRMLGDNDLAEAMNVAISYPDSLSKHTGLEALDILPPSNEIDEFYAHVVKDSKAGKLWRRIGFLPTGKEESIEEDGKIVIREEIMLSKENLLKRTK